MGQQNPQAREACSLFLVINRCMLSTCLEIKQVFGIRNILLKETHNVYQLAFQVVRTAVEQIVDASLFPCSSH
jgi:hypothetical protein